LSAQAPTPTREVAITFDDLPIAGVLPRDIASSRELTRKLLAGIAAHHAPAIAFVNEVKLAFADGSVDPQRVALLRDWLGAGLELGNHSYSHRDLHLTPLDVFEDDVLKGELVTRRLMTERGLTLRFFRHPFLHTGRDLEKKARFELFLGEHGYLVAPVTIDNDEYIFAAAYDRSFARGAADVVRQVADAYVPYMKRKVEFFERNSQDLFGFAAGGFRDFTRIAGSSPEMWRDIALQNRAALLAELDRYGAQLAVFRALIENGEGPGLERLMSEARSARHAWATGPRHGSPTE